MTVNEYEFMNIYDIGLLNISWKRCEARVTGYIMPHDDKAHSMNSSHFTVATFSALKLSVYLRMNITIFRLHSLAIYGRLIN